jgi:endonuclease YncB( thermonuclease family)
MRLRTALFVFFGLIAISGLAVWLRPKPPPAPMAVAPVQPPPTASPPPEPAPAEPAPAPTPPAAAPAPGPEQTALPALPEIRVAEHTIHTVPEDNSPLPGSGHSGQAAAIGQSDEVRLGPRPASGPPVPRQFSGPATATGAVELKVDTTSVALFGIKPPGDADRCGADTGSDCASVARQALADRIGAAGRVSCRIPAPRPGGPARAICLDPNGVDLSGFLIAQGLALADTGQSYDYVGAESIARNLKHGLWKFR